ncbi:hypothetical protein [Nocardioides aquiterrae]|uniref:EthD domain-containing protein n=1 Tax=Nocardioides aquiterrae TaxID=203799 RepID=A0ABP4EYF6_9ACTN
MPKNMFLLWGVEAGALHDAGLHAALADAGVRRLQLNVDDEPVAVAMRFGEFDEPVRAIVCTWDADPAAVRRALREVASEVHGYAVDERRRLDPPESWDGTRADALANVAILRRPADLEREEWIRRWMVEHTPVAIRTQATFGYVQNVVTAPSPTTRRGSTPWWRSCSRAPGSPTCTRSTAAAATTPSCTAGSAS